jgi:hypothetical protein
MSTLKVKLLKFVDLGWQSLAQFRVWLSLGKASSGFEFTADNLTSPSTRVATVTNANGETLAYCPVERILWLREYAVNPTIDPSEAQAAGDLIDYELEKLARDAGISKMLLVVPKDYPTEPGDEFEQVKIFVRKVAPSVTAPGIDCFTPSQATQYLH